MNDNIYFSNNNQINKYIFSSGQNNSNNLLMAFSLRNMSTTYNSFISNDFQLLNNNEIKQNDESNEVYGTKNNEIEIKKTNKYSRKKDYSKFLNLPQSNYSTFCDSKTKFYSKNNFITTNLNSNLKENKIYNKLKINELIEIAQNRKKIIEEKNKLEQLKKLKISIEEEKLLNLIFKEEINIKTDKVCEEGVQTSLTIKKKNNNNVNQNFEIKSNDINITDKNTIENDLVNIGNNTERNIDIDNNSDNGNFNNNEELSFDIEVNEDDLKPNQKKICDDSFDDKNKENSSNSNSNKENEVSRVEEYDIEKEYLKNETKSDIQEYINENEKSNKKEKRNFKLNKSKSVLFMGLNRYENIDIKNSENIEPNIYPNKNQIKCDNSNISNYHKIFKSNINVNKHRTNKLTSKENINNKSDASRTKKKRQMDNYSYYFKLKGKMKK